MSVRMVILGLLRQRPLYGYEIKHVIEDHMGDWTSIAFGSIYFALEKLEKEGLVEILSEKREGNRPSRKVYRVTKAGRDQFLRMLRETWRNQERHYFDIDLCLFFLDALQIQEVRGFVQERIHAQEEILRHVHAHRKEQLATPEIPRQAEWIFEHFIQHAEAELQWTKDLLKRLK